MELSMCGRICSSDKDASGHMRTPAYFCLDGLQLRK